MVTPLSSTKSLLLPAQAANTNQDRSHVAVGVLADIGQPRLDVAEGVLFRDIVDDDRAGRIFVIGVCDRAVPGERGRTSLGQLYPRTGP